jgi:hypothetical protein
MKTIDRRLAALEARVQPQEWARVIVPLGADRDAVLAEQFPDGLPERLIVRRIVKPGSIATLG